MAVSNRARTAINRFLRQQERDEQVRLGREILEKAARRDEWRWDLKDLNQVAPKLPVKELKTAEDVLAAVQYHATENIALRLGYRILEGGVDSDSTYTSALFHYLSAGITYRF